MKIALLADIHSNHMAFNAVLKDLKDKEIDKLWLLGDYIFGGVGSNEVVDLLIALDNKTNKMYENLECRMINGNIDQLIKQIEAGADWIYPANRHIYSKLGIERINFLKRLLDEIIIDEQGVLIRLCHNPSEMAMFIERDALKKENNLINVDALSIISQTMTEELCVFGHYHLFMHEIMNEKHFVCPGSVGMPFNGDTRAQYMILELENGNVTTKRQYVEYSLVGISEAFKEQGFFEIDEAWTRLTIETLLTSHNYIGTRR